MKHLADLEITSCPSLGRASREAEQSVPAVRTGNHHCWELAILERWLSGPGRGWKWEAGEQETVQGIGVGAQLVLRVWEVTNWHTWH